MNRPFPFILLLSLIVLHSCTHQSNEKQKDTEITLMGFQQLNFGEIKPQGWMKVQMKNDLLNGFVGHLDSLAPDLIIDDDIYGVDRLTKEVKVKDVGAITDDQGEWEVQFLWWNSETQSNWWDGLIRHAILTENPAELERVRKYIDEKLSTQDTDGYIGIYAEDLRYNHTTENGELWAQASLFRGLLAWYEYTGNPKVLDAVERAVKLTMTVWPVNASEPFRIDKPYAGVGHGLMFTDVLDRLYSLTGNEAYKDYAVFLFQDYDKHQLTEEDIQTRNLLDPDYHFEGHGVHTYEHLRALTYAAAYSNNDYYKLALEQYLVKLETVLTPSGGPIGDEWIAGREANAVNTGYEYCSIHELLDSYSVLLEKTGNPKWADRIEWLLFNAGQGARHPEEHTIAYCKTDNSYSMLGAINISEVGEEQHNRYKYSPVHKDVAVCCVPNAGRIYPFYVRSMWMRSEKGLVANLFGASVLNTQIDGEKITIYQSTNYPFDFTIDFGIEILKPTEFEIAVRIPSWANSSDVKSNSVIRIEDNFIYLNKEWKLGDEIHIEFSAQPQVNTIHANEQYLSYGPLVYALELEGKPVEIKTYDIQGFRDTYYEMTRDPKHQFQLPTNSLFQILTAQKNLSNPWKVNSIKTVMYNPNSNMDEEVLLYPMGGSILRKVTFDKKN